MIEIDTGADLGTLGSCPVGEFHHVAFSPDGKYLAAVADNRSDVALAGYSGANVKIDYRKTITVWSLAKDGSAKLISDDRNDGVYPLAFSADSQGIRCGPRVYDIDADEAEEKQPGGEAWQEKDLHRCWIHAYNTAAYPGSPRIARISETGDGIDLLDQTSGKLAATLYLLPGGVARIHADGKVAGSGLSTDVIHWMKGTEATTACITGDSDFRR